MSLLSVCVHGGLRAEIEILEEVPFRVDVHAPSSFHDARTPLTPFLRSPMALPRAHDEQNDREAKAKDEKYMAQGFGILVGAYCLFSLAFHFDFIPL